MAKFRIDRVGPPPGDARLVATERLGSGDFTDIAAALGETPRRARKTGFVSARVATQQQTIETQWNGKETTAVAEPGDWIATNMSADGKILRDASGDANTYVITAAKFPDLYERDEGKTEFGDVYRARGAVEALFFPGGFEILALWGEIQRADAGYFLLNGDEVYGNNKETFEATYVVVK